MDVAIDTWHTSSDYYKKWTESSTNHTLTTNHTIGDLKPTTSNLVKETIDTIIYQLFPNGDTGERKAQDTSINYDPDSVYEINVVDRDSYVLAK